MYWTDLSRFDVHGLLTWGLHVVFLQQLTTHAQKVCICLVPVHLEPDAFVNSLSPNQRNTMPHQDFEFLLLVYHLTMPIGDRKLMRQWNFQAECGKFIRSKNTWWYTSIVCVCKDIRSGRSESSK